ncbi:hypothetical protein DQ04_01231010 [Trypanosoma grayi]|uniref:hypothetical protein n=1 Tax=Trypanosoma grayi TaxID=71804 RepID=UPI0004F44DC5|nr:hypothetical protein DQ04_01231010 [Trypanosoma grayi]KEG13066.1 hypothetical protein DQ04_01231010 [Trypanosoma grayi]
MIKKIKNTRFLCGISCITRVQFVMKQPLFLVLRHFFLSLLTSRRAHKFPGRTESGELVEFTRLPMGYNFSSEILHTNARARLEPQKSQNRDIYHCVSYRCAFG